MSTTGVDGRRCLSEVNMVRRGTFNRARGSNPYHDSDDNDDSDLKAVLAVLLRSQRNAKFLDFLFQKISYFRCFEC